MKPFMSLFYLKVDVDLFFSFFHKLKQRKHFTMNMPHELPMMPTEATFHLECDLVVKRVSYNDEQSDGRDNSQEREMVFLIPKESTETYKFLSAWLPAPGTHSEVVISIDFPINQYARAALLLPDERHSSGPYLFLMTYGIEKLIVSIPSLRSRKSFSITVFPESVDHPEGSPTDQPTGDESLTFDKKKYHDQTDDEAKQMALEGL